MADCRLLLVWSVLSIFCRFSVQSDFPVPVLIWSKESSLSQGSPPLAGHTLSAEDFQDKYLKNVLEKTQTVCIFIQDRLSVDDFSHYGDAFAPGSHGSFNNLKVAMDTANSSVVLPSVDATFEGLTAGVIDFIKSSIQGQVISIKEEDLDTFSIGKDSLDSQVTNVFVVYLHPVEISSPANAGLVFSQNDELMASITKQIAAASPSYTCILTGDSPSKMVLNQQLAEERSSLPHDRLRREADEDEAKTNTFTFNNKTLFINGDCIFMNMGGMVVTAGKQSVDVLNTTSLTGTVKSTCANDSASSVTVNLKHDKLDTITLTASFNRTKSEWYCADISIIVKGTVDGEKVDVDKTYPCAKQIRVPMQMSYHCYNTTVSLNATDGVKFLNFQVQPYGIKSGKFSYAYDCVGFFSIPILMALLTMGVLLMILFFGVMAVFSITTMDRFDDPKGPGITIVAQG